MIIGFIGKPRSGKTTFLASYVAKNEFYHKLNKLLHFKAFPEYDVIYSSEYIKGTVHIKPYDVGRFKPTPNSLIILGEAGVYFSNREFKNVPKECLDFFSLHGHYHCDIVWDSQTVDVDKKLRNRTECMYIVKKGRIFSWNSYARLISYDVDVDNESHDIVEGFSIAKGLWKVLAYLTRANKVLWRTPLYKFFDSYSQPLHFSLVDPALKVVKNDGNNVK